MSEELCTVCHEEPGCIADPHVGQVCPDCYLELIFVRSELETVGRYIGIGDCQEKQAA